MSEFSNTAEKRINDLFKFMMGLINGKKGADLVKKYNLITENYIPADVLAVFDRLFNADIKVDEMKTASNKLFNILYKTLNSYPNIKFKENSFIDLLHKDNEIALRKLLNTRPFIKKINKEIDTDSIAELKTRFVELEKFMLHYTVKENVLFPILESNWQEHQCVKLMWSFHDDIRRNFKKTNDILNSKEFDLKEFNKYSSLLFFNINTIKFREEKVLFPIMIETLKSSVLEKMLDETIKMGLPFVKINKKMTTKYIDESFKDNLIEFATGKVTIEQIEIIFNHLPIDITYVDENDEVRFFSNPPHRIFPRTAAIIGRKVHNCHPPESVHVVEKIVASFKSGEKSVASFWIHVGPKYVLIQYFAVRNKKGEYKGTLEVSQEISGIQKIKGDRKLLDW
jgi:hypothetical protein